MDQINCKKRTQSKRRCAKCAISTYKSKKENSVPRKLFKVPKDRKKVRHKGNGEEKLMAQAAEFTFTKLREQLHLIRLPPDREWGILKMDKYPYIAFLNMEDMVSPNEK